MDAVFSSKIDDGESGICAFRHPWKDWQVGGVVGALEEAIERYGETIREKSQERDRLIVVRDFLKWGIEHKIMRKE
jgi:hypothetical protein